MRKIFMSSLLLVALLSCKKDLPIEEASKVKGKVKGTASRLAFNDQVKLQKARTVAAFYSSSYIREKAFYAEISNIARDKKVFVHHKMTDGTWKDFPLFYMNTTDNSNEIWGWDINYGLGTPYASEFASNAFNDEFAIKYIANGQTYWDNNGGKNYNISSPYNTDGMFMQDGLNIIADTYHSYFNNGTTSSNVQIYADVRNLNYNKIITLVYTTDNWQTVKYTGLNYLQQYAYGGSNLFAFPNKSDFEKWSANFTVPSSETTIKYAISYKVNGTEYWDSNFGNNYTIIKK